MARFGVVVILSLFLTGCFCPFWQHTKPQTVAGLAPVKGKVLLPERLKEGGNILVMPFSPGSDAPANEEMDKIALRMVRGLTEILSLSDASFKILDSSNAAEAEMVVKGRIDRYQRKRAGWLRKGLVFIAVKGDVVDLDSGKTIAWFEHVRDSDGRTVPAHLAEQLGADIGKFLFER